MQFQNKCISNLDFLCSRIQKGGFPPPAFETMQKAFVMFAVTAQML